MVLPPLIGRLVALVAQMARVARGLLGAVPTIERPPRRVTPDADDEIRVTPPASNVPPPRMLVHRLAPSWCDRREELEPDRARVRNTGRTSASLEGSGCNPGPPSLRRPLRRGLPRNALEGRLLGPLPQPSRPLPLSQPRDPPAVGGWGHGPRRSRRKWYPLSPAMTVSLGILLSSLRLPHARGGEPYPDEFIDGIPDVFPTHVGVNRLHSS